MILRVVRDLASLISSALRSRAQLAAENLFLKKQLALYLERQVKPRRADDATRMALVALSRFVDWRRLLTIVKPDTLLHWHRKGFRLFWRWKSRRPGRPAIPAELRELIATMAVANRTWGEERIAAELLDFVIALSERHLRAVLHVWVAHYNRGRPQCELRTRHSRELRPCAAVDRPSASGRGECNGDANSGRSSSRVPSHATSGVTTFEWPSQVFADHKRHRRVFPLRQSSIGPTGRS